jgi:hypothetical protein
MEHPVVSLAAFVVIIIAIDNMFANYLNHRRNMRLYKNSNLKDDDCKEI